MSKRTIKNIVMIILIITLCMAMYFTINHQNNSFPNVREDMFKQMPEDGEIPNEVKTQEGMEFSDDTNGSADKAKGQRGNRGEMEENMPENMTRRITGMSTSRILICVLESLGVSLLTIYLILSKFNKLTLKETFDNKSNITAYVVLVVLVTAIIVMLVMLLNKNSSGKNFEKESHTNKEMFEEDSNEKLTKAEDVDSGKTVNSKTINLDEHTSNITISEAGNYTLTGSFEYAVLIDADGDVTLNLENVNIENKTTAALANISTNSLTINLVDGTTNTFSDGGSSEYDACVYSAGPIIIKGSGNLEVYGNQEEGEGIATKDNNITIDGGNIKITSNDDGLNAGGDGGTIKINDGTIYIKASGDGIDSNKNIVINGGYLYTIGSSKGGDSGLDADEGIQINGGTVIAIGSDMLEIPKDNSKQKYIAKNLDTTIKNGNQIYLKDAIGNEIITFTANEDFKTIILSDATLLEGSYNLYSGETLITTLECK